MREFSVDDACMGLSMVTIGLLLGVFLLAYFQYKTQKIISLLQVFLSLLVIFILVISANLFRIIFLVQFQVLPDNILHEIIGVLCFAAYVLLPALLVIKFIIKKSTVKNITRLGLKAKSRADEIYYFLLLVLLAIVIIRVNNSKNQSSMLAATGISLPGYSSELINNEIIKAENGNALIYVKHIKGFYSTEHSPMICWRGSGYEMASVQEMKIGKRNVYSGILKEGKNKLYTAWWFDNGDYQTTDQLDWRWKVLRGAQEFSIVNVTTTSTAELVKSVERVMADNLVRHARLKR